MKKPALTPLSKSLIYFGLALIVFSLFRIALYVSYRDYFGQLSAGQILAAFVHGVRFDAAIIALFFALPLLLINLPLRFALSNSWQKILAWLLWAVSMAMGAVLAADIVYFGYVNRHIATELSALGQDLGAVIHIALTGYTGAVIAYVALGIGLALGWARISARDTAPNRHGAIKFVLIFLCLVMTGRGWTFYGKPIGVVHAFVSGSAVAGNLTLNGLFSAVQTN
ncbi:MAG: hypothetical protein HY081_01235 [Gammaproteobacteria bacterium]|nr:hypothetical protein [Gammaproteobacteria bacterium]